MAEFESRRAFEHIDKLAYEIGPRLAGTRGDQMAADYIQNQFKSYGLKTRVQEFKFVDRTSRSRAAAILLAAAFVVALFIPPVLSLLAWLAAIAAWRSLGWMMPKRSTQNIIATLRAGSPKKRVAVTAHYDSARCVVNRRLCLFLKFAFLPALSLVLTTLVLRALGFVPAWPVVWGVLALVFLPICAGMFVAASSRRVSPGANDNAAGVAVMLEAARALADSPPDDIELRFIATSAEEQGLVGARKLMAGKMLPFDTLVLNLDGVGTGSQAYIIEGNGLLKRRRTSSRLNQALANSIGRAGLEPKLWWAALAGHDHIPLVRAKVHATTLTFDDGGIDKLGRLMAKLFRLPNIRGRSYRYIHTMEDTPDHLELKTIERAGAVVLDFVKTIKPN